MEKLKHFRNFFKNNIEKVLDNIGLTYTKDKEYYYTNQIDGFTFTISRENENSVWVTPWVKSEYFGYEYKIDYVDNLENYITDILKEKPDLSNLTSSTSTTVCGRPGDGFHR